MIFIGMGANLPSAVYGSPEETLNHCLKRMNECGLKVVKHSHWYKSAPVPMSDHPWYVNGIAAIQTTLPARTLLEKLLEIEHQFGRIRTEANAPRVLDLDLIAYDDQIIEDEGKLEDKPFCVPHPRMQERAFVLLPLQEMKPDWHHPKSGLSVDSLIAALPKGQIIEMIDQD